jgi:serine/threonine protein kinase
VAIVAHAVPHRLGQYRLVNHLGTGQACQIWEAALDGASSHFALKVLPQHVADADLRNLLRHEFEVCRALDHHSVIKMYDFVRDPTGTAYLAMEFFPAPNMKQWIQQGTERLMPMILQIIEHAAEALEHVHHSGWIHRDIKPDNYLIDEAGNVRLIDLALAQRKKGLLGKLFSIKAKVQGTRSYMSPEQIRGEPLDARTDIYSFGSVLFELIGGRPPFSGASTNELLNKHLNLQAPALELTNPNVSYSFARLVRNMLAKNPADRPASMTHVLGELKNLKVFEGAARSYAT